MSCQQCQGIEHQFDRKTAESDLKHYHKKGLPKSTRMLIEEIEKLDVMGATLLDIGGGVGMVQHELFKAGISRATHVDASSAYLRASQEEAERQGHRDRVDYRFGNFVDLAGELEQADLVTLDKVICCYDDMRALVRMSSAKARKFYGVIFPKDSWWSKLALRIMNFMLGLTRNDFRTYLHETKDVDELVRENGLKPLFHHHGFFWQVIGYTR